jgi:hypothetical protein
MIAGQKVFGFDFFLWFMSWCTLNLFHLCEKLMVHTHLKCKLFTDGMLWFCGGAYSDCEVSPVG